MNSPARISVDLPDVMITPRSPTRFNRVIQRRDSVVRENKRNEWRSCCFILDRRCLLFLMQVVVTILMMLFSMYKLAVSDECSPDRQVFSSTLTLCLSIWIPSPKIGKKDNN